MAGLLEVVIATEVTIDHRHHSVVTTR